MITITFTEAEINALQQERYHHPHPRVQRKMDALYLKSQGQSHRQIARLLRISPMTLRTYLHEYQAGGIERLKQLNFHRPESELAKHSVGVEAHLREHPVATVAEASEVIEKLTGLRRSPTQVRKFLHRIGAKRCKVGIVPAKADPEVQQAFKAEKLEPRIAQAESGQRALFFVDAAHFVLGAFIGYLWCFARLFIKTPSGRQRLNVLGALNPITLQMITVINDTYITATTVCQLLTQIAQLGLGVPITLVMDNARYQHCQMVEDHAQRLGIELLFLPAYSPNLNLIERMWKFVKKKCLYSKYYPDFASFKAAICDCVTHAHVQYKDELASLLTLKFQTFKIASL